MEPIAQIFQLTEGYVLATAGHSVACTNLTSLKKAINDLLPIQGAAPVQPANVVALAPRPPAVQQATQAIPHAGQVPVPPPSTNPTQAVQDLTRLASTLPPEQVTNLYKMADACYRGLLQTSDIPTNLEKYCPNLSREGWNLFYGEYVADRRGEEDGD